MGSDLLSNPNRLLTVEELAEVTGLPVKTLRNWVPKGIGPRRIHIGRYVRYRVSDVQTWLDSQYVD